MLEVLIIGAGPTGLYAAFLAGLRKLNAAVIESAGEPGGQLTAVYKDKFIYDIPGFPKVTAKLYIDEQVKQLERFKSDIPVYYGEEAMEITKVEDYFIVKTEKSVYETKTILIAHGGGGFVPQKLKIDKHFENILYFVKDLNVFKDKHVAVLGGGDSALDWAVSLLDYAKDVTLVHRRNEFRALPTTVDEFKERGTILTPYLIDGVNGEKLATELVLKNVQTGEQLTLNVDYILVNYGFLLSKSKLEEWGIKGEKGLIEVDYLMQTNVEGIYAAGNGVSYPGKVKLISTGQGEAATAIQSITTKLYPERNKNFEHSTSLIKE
ncbi:NAD(P)/FAD-dependent oxidoreductase [Acholeplasma equirhinis]|uniref:NAD(P)/FAD-dependent oxidoreductase n=1 Tax=Acholeplasma equirhinis TaxID=555393 RepID=UPI00197A84D7|nr:NAD(P)/FAD-dependent oxidoreductase [Acholeplasma equirhinis]MBN3490197.1 NAD(P)/FAD-dependent oxidoreductase [Acholeplasma equirhinis]